MGVLSYVAGVVVMTAVGLAAGAALVRSMLDRDDR